MLCLQLASASTLALFSDALNAKVSLLASDSKVNCRIAGGIAFLGTSAIRVSTGSYLGPGDTCGLVFKTATNLTSYSELQFYLRATPNSVYGHIDVKDSANKVVQIQVQYPTTYKQIRIPLKGTLASLNISSIISPLAVEPQISAGAVVYVDEVTLLSRDYFPIFSDETKRGLETIQSWGGNNCQALIQLVGLPVGTRVLQFPVNTWGCGIQFINPSLNLNGFHYLQFNLKSTVAVHIEIHSETAGTKSVAVASTNGLWKAIKLPLSQFNINLSKIIVPFGIIKQEAGTKLVQVNFVRYTL